MGKTEYTPRVVTGRVKKTETNDNSRIELTKKTLKSAKLGDNPYYRKPSTVQGEGIGLFADLQKRGIRSAKRQGTLGSRP